MLTVMAGFGSFGVAAVIGITHWRHQTKQTKIASANLILELIKDWTRNTSFPQTINKLRRRSNVIFTDGDDLHFMFKIFDNIAILKNDGTLDDTHVREFFGRDIVRIGANKSIMRILSKYYDADPDYNYNNLNKLLVDSKKWGMMAYSPEESSSDTY